MGLPVVRPVRHCRFRQCGQPDRRARRACDRAGDDRGRDARTHRLYRRQLCLFALPSDQSRAFRGRSHGGQRRVDWRGSRLLVVQRAPSPDLHGRHGVAGARRIARHNSCRDQARGRAGRDWRVVRDGGGVGRRAGRVVQAHGQAGVPHGAHSSSFRAARLVGAANRHALLDHRLRARDGRPRLAETEVTMIPVETLRGQSVALFGLGGSGLSTAQALLAGGAEVAAWDDSSAARERAAAAGGALVDLAHADWRDFRVFVLAPGVPLTHPKPHWTVNLADAAGVPIIGDIELFVRERGARAPDAPFVAITGTNGKSTTTALIAHILREAGRDVAMGGNIGVPILDLPPPSDQRIHVVECSSFQIDLAPSLAPSVGLLINVTPDHLDRHGTLEAYAAIKERLVAAADIAIVGVDDEYCRAIAVRLKDARANRLVAISAHPSPLADVWI